MLSACKSPTCATTHDKVAFTYDGEGHRTQIVSDPAGTGAGQGPSTWVFRYQDDAVVEERLTDATHTDAVVRSYVVDDSGSVVKMVIPPGEADAGTYIPVWNGHGDAVNLSRLNTDGSLTLANSYRYETWGKPTTATHNSIGDLGFRFLYVGEFDVQWDDQLGLGLLYMHARHYSPALGRFVQPDPDRSEANLYAYAADNPVTELDPDGTCFIVCGVIGAAVSIAIYAATTDKFDWGEAAKEGAIGGVLSMTGVGLIAKVASAGRLLTKVPKASRIIQGVAKVAQRTRTVSTRIVNSTKSTRFIARKAVTVKRKVTPYLRDQRSDWIRFGKTKVSKQITHGPGTRGFTWRRAIKGGGRNPKTGFTLPFHYHVGLYNITRPSIWFKKMAIL